MTNWPAEQSSEFREPSLLLRFRETALHRFTTQLISIFITIFALVIIVISHGPGPARETIPFQLHNSRPIPSGDAQHKDSSPNRALAFHQVSIQSKNLLSNGLLHFPRLAYFFCSLSHKFLPFSAKETVMAAGGLALELPRLPGTALAPLAFTWWTWARSPPSSSRSPPFLPGCVCRLACRSPFASQLLLPGFSSTRTSFARQLPRINSISSSLFYFFTKCSPPPR